MGMREDMNVDPRKKIVKWALIAFAAVMGFSMLMGCFYVVPAGQVGVIQLNGGSYVDVQNAGTHAKYPFFEKVLLEDVRLHVVNYSANNKSDGSDDTTVMDNSGIIAEPALPVLDTKNVGYGIDLTVQFTPMSGDMKDILEKYGTNYFDKLLHPLIRATARDVGGQYAVESIADHRDEFETKLRITLEERTKGLPLTLNGVFLRNIDLPDTIKERIVQVQQAQQEKQKLDVMAQQALVNRQIKDTNAGADADVAKITAEGEANAILAKATAQAKAYQLMQQTLTPLLVENNRINAFKEKWDGSLPTTFYSMGGGGMGNLLFNLPAPQKEPSGGKQ